MTCRPPNNPAAAFGFSIISVYLFWPNCNNCEPGYRRQPLWFLRHIILYLSESNYFANMYRFLARLVHSTFNEKYLWNTKPASFRLPRPVMRRSYRSFGHITEWQSTNRISEVVVWCRIEIRNNWRLWWLGVTWVVVWCRIEIRNNYPSRASALQTVVVWCRIEIRNNLSRFFWCHCSVVVWCRIEIRNNFYGYRQYGCFVVVWCRIEIRNNLGKAEREAAQVVVWCRIEIRNNGLDTFGYTPRVVVWCRIEIRNNRKTISLVLCRLWFDVELK